MCFARKRVTVDTRISKNMNSKQNFLDQSAAMDNQNLGDNTGVVTSNDGGSYVTDLHSQVCFSTL